MKVPLIFKSRHLLLLLLLLLCFSEEGLHAQKICIENNKLLASLKIKN